MTPGHSDPNNHVPDVAGDDAWDDAAAVPRLEPLARIPSRGARHGAPVGTSLKPEAGIRIDGPNQPKKPDQDTRRLKVETIGASVVRLETEVAPPRVERIVTFHERPTLSADSHQNRGEGSDWGKKHTISPRWILAMGATVVTLVVLGMLALPSINAPNAVLPEAQAPPHQPDAHEKSLSIVALNRLLDRQPEAIQIYRSFVAAAHPDEIDPLIRDAPGMRETLRQWWQPMRLPGQWEPAADSGWQVMELEGHPCALLSGRLPDNSKFQAYFVADGDKLLLDWKATTGFGTAHFKDLEQGRGTGSEIRGEISLTDFYTLEFPEKDYQSFRFVSPDREHFLWCYASRDSAAYPKISNELLSGAIVEKVADSKKVTLHLERGSDGTLPNQWLIQDLLQIDWVNR